MVLFMVMLGDPPRRPGPVERFFLERTADAESDAASSAWYAGANAIHTVKKKVREFSEG